METQTEWLTSHPWLNEDTRDDDIDETIRFSLDEIRIS